MTPKLRLAHGTYACYDIRIVSTVFHFCSVTERLIRVVRLKVELGVREWMPLNVI